MSSFALLLTLVAALLHATWNLAAKRATGRAVFGFQTALVTAIIFAPLAAAEMIKLPNDSFLSWTPLLWGIVGGSSLVHVVYFLCLLQGYRVAPMSIVYPVARGAGPLLSYFLAVFVFKETVTVAGFGGMILILVGVMILSQPSRRLKATASFDLQSIRKGVLWGMVTGMFIAAYTIIDAYAVKSVGILIVQYQYFMNLLMLPFYMLIAKGWHRHLYPTRDQLRAIFILSILGPAGYMLVLWAVQIAPVSHVAPAREVSMMFAAILGGRFLKEGDYLKRFLAAGLIVIGVWLLAA